MGEIDHRAVVTAALGLIRDKWLKVRDPNLHDATEAEEIAAWQEEDGGEPDGVQMWNSYPFPDSETHLNDIYDRLTDSTRQFWTLPYVPGPRYLDRFEHGYRLALEHVLATTTSSMVRDQAETALAGLGKDHS